MRQTTDRETGRVVYDSPGAVPVYLPLPLPEVIGRRVRELRMARGWRQIDLARRLAVVGLPWQQGGIANLERGGRQLTLEEALCLCRAFDVPLADLLPDHPARAAAQLPLLTTERGEVPLEAARWYLSAGSRGNRDLDVDRIAVAEIDDPRHGSRYADHLLEQAEVVRKAARSLGVPEDTVRAAARELWGMPLWRKRDLELDDRLRDDPDEVTPRALQAKRGHVTRGLLAELREHLQRHPTAGESAANGHVAPIDTFPPTG